MNSFLEWKIKDLINTESEFYFTEQFIGIRTENEKQLELPGKTVYQIVDHDEESGNVIITDDQGERYKVKHSDLCKALAEDAGAHTFQVLQYPVGYVMATSSDSLSKLSIYDGRLKKLFSKTQEKKDKKK